MSELPREFARTYARALTIAIALILFVIVGAVLGTAFLMWPIFAGVYVETGVGPIEAMSANVADPGYVWWGVAVVWNLLAWPAIFSALHVAGDDEGGASA